MYVIQTFQGLSPLQISLISSYPWLVLWLVIGFWVKKHSSQNCESIPLSSSTKLSSLNISHNPETPSLFYILIVVFCCLFVCLFLGPQWHVEVPRPGVKSELQLLPYTTAIAAQDPNCIATYSRAHGNVGSLTHWTRPGIEHASSWILSQICFHWATTGSPTC